MGCQKCLLSLLLKSLMKILFNKMSFIFTPGVKDNAPKEIDSIGGGYFIAVSGNL